MIIEKWLNQTDYVSYSMKIGMFMLYYFTSEKSDTQC